MPAVFFHNVNFSIPSLLIVNASRTSITISFELPLCRDIHHTDNTLVCQSAATSQKKTTRGIAPAPIQPENDAVSVHEATVSVCPDCSWRACEARVAESSQSPPQLRKPYLTLIP